MLHGRSRDRLERIAKDVNRKMGHRIFYPRIGTIHESRKLDAAGLASFWGRVTRLVGYEAVSRSLHRLGIDRDWVLHRVKRLGRGAS